MAILPASPSRIYAQSPALDVAPLVPPCSVWPCQAPIYGLAVQSDGLRVLLCRTHMKVWSNRYPGRPRKLAAG